MIKTAYDITIGDLAKTEQTGTIAHFKKWYNILPAQLFVKKIARTVDDIYKNVNNGKSSDFELLQKTNEQKYVIEKTIEVQEYEALYLIVTNHLVNYVRLMNLKGKIRSRKLRKIKDNNHILSKAIDDIQAKAKIKITKLDDLAKLRALIFEKKERLQNFINDVSGESEGEKIGIITMAYRYLNYLKLSYDPEKLRVVHFFDLMKMADEQAKKEMEHINKVKAS